MPITYINSAGSSSVTLNACDDGSGSSGWTSLSGTATIASSSYVEREGTDCIEWGGDTGGPRGAYYDLGVGNEINLDNDDLSVWFLPAEKYSGTTYLTLDGTDTDAVTIRASSAGTFTTNYGEYDRALGGVNRLIPSWNSLICSGNTTSRTSGTFDRTSVRSFGVVTNQVGDNNTSFFTSTPDHGMDWYKLGRDIQITGTNGGSPWTFDDIYTALETSKPFHGLVEKRENLFIFNCGLIFGDGTTATTFSDDSKYIFINQSSSQVKHDFRVKANATVTLGKKTTGATRNYATGGIRISTAPTANHSSEFVIEDGATVNLYGCKIENWNSVDIGNAAGTDPTVEMIKIDFFNNDAIDLDSTSLTALDVRMHFAEGSEAALSRLLASPSSIKDLRVFQTTTGLEVRANCTIEDYYAGDNTIDLLILEGVTTTLKNPAFYTVTKTQRTAT